MEFGFTGLRVVRSRVYRSAATQEASETVSAIPLSPEGTELRGVGPW